MSQLIGILLTIVSIATTCTALPDIHKRMSAHQLLSVFHVDNANAVPHYEVVQLLHHNAADGAADAAAPLEHYRNRRSINVAATGALNKEPHHVKKDLSKNPYYSELKAAATGSANSVHEKNAADKVIYSSSVDGSVVPAVQNVSFSAFGEHMNLTLRPTQGLFKGSPHTLRMWTVNSEPNATHGLDMREVLEEDHQSQEHIGEVYQDEANMAAILMRRHMETGDLIMEGSIGHEMVIRPLPHELSPSKEETHHIVYKREAAQLDHLSDFAFMEPDDLASSEKLEKLQKRQRRSAITLADIEEEEEAREQELFAEGVSTDATHKRAKRQAPFTIYPEVLVIVDYDGYRLHGGDNLQVKRYFISFWNGVDLRYRLLKGPRIRISIAGIIISRGRDATPYLERNRVGRDAIDSAAALTDMGKYLFRERRLPVYDIAVAITKLDMCRRTSAYGECNRGTAGFAYVGGACVVNKRLEKVNSVAIIEDTGGFSGIIVAAHEVGHLLGAVHDGSPPPSYLGGPGAQRCRWEDGYIMSDLRHTERGFRWSPCTVQSFHHFLNGDTATCLHNAPHEDGALGRSLPGTLLSLDAQCRRDRGTYACFKDERVCAQLFCFDAQTGYCVAYRPAAEGSSCGNGVHCLDGRCTPLPSNDISEDYRQQYRLVYKNAAKGTHSGENVENSSEEDEKDDEEDGDDTDDDEEDEEEEDDDSNRSVEEENSVQRLSKNDNSVEETVLTINDKEDEATTPTTTGETLTIFTTNTQNTTPNTQIRTQISIDTFKYLTRILENNKQWQHLLATTTPTPTTTATPTLNTLTTEQLQQLQEYGAVVVKTSTSSSISSSSSSGSSKSSQNSSDNIENSSSDSNNSSSSNVSKAKHELTPTPQTHIQQTEPPPPTPQQQHTQQQHEPNMLKMYSAEFRKQFQYYLSLLQQNSSIGPSLNRNVTKLPTPNPTRTTTTKQESSTNSKNSNYSGTTNNDGNPDNNAADIDDDNADDDSVESNEAIGKQKRKFDDVQISTTTTSKSTAMQQPQPLVKQQQPPPATTTPTGTATAIPRASAGPTRNYAFGGRSTVRGQQPTQQHHSFFDTYFKKAFHAAPPAPIPTLISTTSSVSTGTATSTSSKQQHKQLQQQQQQKQQEHFGSQFLKRTLSNSQNSSKHSSSIINSSSSSSSSSSDNQEQQQQQQQQKPQREKKLIAAKAVKTTTTTTTEPPAYVTNYIGDNTNHLPAVLDVQPHEQQQLQASTQQQQQPQHPKFKTQKLIRRQLRTQIK